MPDSGAAIVQERLIFEPLLDSFLHRQRNIRGLHRRSVNTDSSLREGIAVSWGIFRTLGPVRSSLDSSNHLSFAGQFEVKTRHVIGDSA